MTKQIKRALFYSAMAVFLILSYVVVLYAQGYKYSFSENRFFKTGAVYLKANTGADIYLDDKFIGNTSFFNNSYRLEGLLPGRYMIRLQKNDHSTWQKLVIVDEGFVSEFSKIVLIPRNEEGLEELDKEIALIFPAPTPTPQNGKAAAGQVASVSEPFIIKKGVLSTVAAEPERIAENVKGFALSKDGNKLAWWTANEIWVMWLNDANYQPYHKAGDKELVTRYSIPIRDAAWFRDNDHLVLDTGYFNVVEIDTRGGINIVTF